MFPWKTYSILKGFVSDNKGEEDDVEVDLNSDDSRNLDSDYVPEEPKEEDEEDVELIYVIQTVKMEMEALESKASCNDVTVGSGELWQRIKMANIQEWLKRTSISRIVTCDT